MNHISQLTLRLSLNDDATFENFFPGNNALLITALKKCLSRQGDSFIYLWGDQGTGRTHLLQACCHAISEQCSAFYLDLKESHRFSPAILEGLDQIHLVCLDNINAVLDDPRWEESLFHFYNRINEKKNTLIATGSVSPSALICHLEDLRSRLAWGLSLQVKPLNDRQKIAALTIRAKNRGILLPKAGAEYLLRHMSRNLKALFKMLERLEKATLTQQRGITVPLIKTTLSQEK